MDTPNAGVLRAPLASVHVGSPGTGGRCQAGAGAQRRSRSLSPYG